MDPNQLMSGGVQMPQPTPGEDTSNLTPEQKQAELDQLMGMINDKKAIFDGQLQSANTQMSEETNKAVEMLFDILMKNGVDPSNQEEVATFLNQLKEENPEGYLIFEQAVNAILSQQATGEAMQPPEGMTPPESKMDELAQLPPPVPGPDMSQAINQVPQVPVQ